MAIKGLQAKVWDSFRGGRYTRNNLAKISDDHVLVASQMIFLGDGVAHKRPGYTLVRNVGFNPSKIFDFRRQSDAKQFIFLTGSGKIAFVDSAGVNAPTFLSIAEDAVARWQFATNVFAAYGSNGVNAYKFVDIGGVLTKRNWGIQQPIAAPTFTPAVGTLTPEFGYQWAYSWVSKWTDAVGTLRVHVGPPSTISASTGPGTNQLYNLAGLLASADPQVTHLWIWRTNDTPFNTTSVLYFAAEIANGVTTYGDSSPDTALDISRLIPYENFAPPAARILVEYQGRIALMGIPGRPDLVQGTGLEEVDLGIAQETAPPSVFFNIPGGIKAITAGIEWNENLMISTELGWCQVQGFSAETFVERDFILQPGAAGEKLVASTPTWMVWVGKDKKIWAWNGVSDALEISWKIARADGSNQLSMESLDDTQLANGELRWYSWGRYSLLALLCTTRPGLGYFDWVQLWDLSVLTGPQGPYGETTKDGRLLGASESDAFFSSQIIASGNVLVGSRPYLWLADNQGNIYRWPDGFTDNGTQYSPVVGSEFSDCDLPEFQKRFRFLDARTNRDDAKSLFGVSALAADGVNIERLPYSLPVQAMPANDGGDPTCLRAKMEIQGVSVGRFVRWFVEFPIDDQPAKLYAAAVKWSPVQSTAQ